MFPSCAVRGAVSPCGAGMRSQRCLAPAVRASGGRRRLRRPRHKEPALRWSAMIWDGFRLAVGLLTAIPVRTGRAGRASGADGAGTGGAGGAGTGGAGRTGGGWSVSRQTAAAAMAWAPAVGLALGVAAAAVLVGADRLLRAGPLLAAVLAVVTLALLTRGLHLDGLADLADGLGSRRTAPAALEIMKRSDIGPFGVTTLVLTLFVQVAALAQAQPRGTATLAA